MVGTETIRTWFDFITKDEFESETDETITLAIEASREYADLETLGAGKYRDAVANHAAHLLKKQPSGSGGGAGGGAVKRIKNQQREVEYFQSGANKDPEYQSTNYGQAYEAILDGVMVAFEVI